MSAKQRTILVFGATGRQGGSVAHALIKAGWQVRALVRDRLAAKAGALAELGVDVVEGSLNDADSIRHAMQKVSGVFAVLPADLAAEEEVRAGSAIADLSVEAGIEHLIYSSGGSVGAEPTGVPRFDAKPRVEAYIRTLPITATIVRPMIFMEMLAQPSSGLSDGKLVSLVHSDQTMQLIAVRDIGNFVTAMFGARAAFAGKTITIAGDRITGHDLAALFGQTLHRTITYSRLADAAFAANPDLKHMASSLDDGPLSEPVDLNAMRQIVPDLLSVGDWLHAEGGTVVAEAAHHHNG